MSIRLWSPVMPITHTAPAILLEWIRNLKNSDAEALLIWLSNTDLPELELLSHIVITHPEVQIGKTTV